MTHLLLSILVSQVVAQQPDTSQKVTFHMAAAPMARVLEALSQTTKVPMAASKKTAPDVMVIDVKDVSLKDLMDRIALADTAEWIFENGTYRLNPATGKRNIEARDELQKKVSALKKSIEDRMKPPTPHPGGRRPNEDEIGPADPEQFDLLRVLASLNLTEMVTMRPDDRIVYATSPNAMQRPLGSAANGPIANMVRRHNKQVAMQKDSGSAPMERAGEAEVEEPENNFLSPELMARFNEMAETQSKPIRGPIAKGILIVSGNDSVPGVPSMIAMKLFDGKGKVVKHAQTYLSEYTVDDSETPNPDETKPGTKFIWSDGTKQIADAFLTTRSGAGISFPKDLQAKLDRPDLYDPLSFFASDIAFTFAQQKRQPLVAVLPDEMTSVGLQGVGDTLESFQDSLKKQIYLKEIPNVGWTLLAPSKPESSRQERLDRVPYAQLLQSVNAKGGLRLDALAAYAVAHPNPTWAPAAAFTSKVSLNATSMLGSEPEWPSLRFYGLLSPSDRSLLRQGGTLSFASLNGPQRNAASQLVFGSNARLETLRAGQPPSDPDDPLASLNFLSMYASVDYQDEPTELFPRGLPTSGGLSARISNEFFLSLAENTNPITDKLGVSEMAMFQLMQESTPQLQDIALPKSGKVGNRAIWHFIFHLSPQVITQFSLYDDQLPADAKEVQLDALPDPFRQMVAARKEKLRKGPLGMLRGGSDARPANGTP